MTEPTKVIGVMGGLGPAATLNFFGRIISKTNALRDQDHLRVIIDNNTKIPDRNAAAAGNGPSPGPALAATARGLEIAGAEIIVMACNAAHAHEREIREAISAPFLSMIDETADAVAALKLRPKRIGLLAADGCLAANLYQDALRARGMAAVLLSSTDQRAFMDVIYAIKSGEIALSREPMRKLAGKLVDQGAEVILAGCTEAPLVIAAQDVAVPFVSSTDVLVERAIVLAGAKLKS